MSKRYARKFRREVCTRLVGGEKVGTLSEQRSLRILPSMREAGTVVQCHPKSERGVVRGFQVKES